MKRTMVGISALLLCVFGTVQLAHAQLRDHAVPQAVGIPEQAGEFDFWIGTWSAPGGTDKVKRFGKGVAVLETWSGGGGPGWSVNVYDKATGTWTQTWFHSSGTFTQFKGKKEGDRIVLVAETQTPTGEPSLMRLSFIEITKKSFTQLYEHSTDGGATWVELNRLPFTRIK